MLCCILYALNLAVFFFFFFFFFYCSKFTLTFKNIADNNSRLQKSIDPDEAVHNEPSNVDLRCLKFSLSTLHINLFPSDSLLRKKKKKKKKKKKTDEKVV